MTDAATLIAVIIEKAKQDMVARSLKPPSRHFLRPNLYNKNTRGFMIEFAPPDRTP